MSYSYGVPVQGVFVDANATEENPIVVQHVLGLAAYQVELLGDISPAVSSQTPAFIGLPWFKNLWFTLFFDETEVYRRPLHRRSTMLLVPQDALAAVESLRRDLGLAGQQSDRFTVRIFAPIDQQIRVFSRDVLWNFD